MKNNLMLAIVFIVLGLACFTLSTLSKDHAVEKWASFLFGLSFPLFIGGIIALVGHFRKSNEQDSPNG